MTGGEAVGGSVWGAADGGVESVVDFPTERRMHVSLNVHDLAVSVPFYRLLFDADPTKVREGYARFEVEEPALNLSLNQHPGSSGGQGHFGIQVKSTEAVVDAWRRLVENGFAITTEDEVECCYAVQTKIWAADPDGNRWEVFVTTVDASDEGCGPECICHQELERTYIAALD